MKNYIIFSLLVLFAYSCKKDVVNAKKDDSQEKIAKVHQINKLAKEIKRIDEEQAGMCDTCSASFNQIVAENRDIAYKVNQQRITMIKMYLEMQSTEDSNRLILEKTKAIFARNKSLYKKFERLENEEILADTH